MKDYTPNKPDEQKDNDVFKQLQGEQIKSLKDEIKEIEEQITERQVLSTEVKKNCEAIKITIENMINEFKGSVAMSHSGGSSGDTSALGALIRLRQEQAAMDQFVVKEKTDAWKDIAELKKELRELVREFRERESRVDMLDKILVG
jgi:hypothetical protein